MREACAGEPSGELLRGIEQFNRGEYYECHETLETLWLAEPSELRVLYQGVLQVGVGLHHLLRGNYRGAVALLERGTDRLQGLGPECLGIDVEGLVREAEACRWELLGLGPARVGEFDRSLLPTVRLAGDKPPALRGTALNGNGMTHGR